MRLFDYFMVRIGQEFEIVLLGLEKDKRWLVEVNVMTAAKYFDVELHKVETPDILYDVLRFKSSTSIPSEFYRFFNDNYETSFNYKPITFIS